MTITILDDESTENNESFVLYLTSGVGVYLSPYSQSTVTIIDDDGKLEGSVTWEKG